ncbi:uncharacterized protein LOC135832419 [Planococcus citri]|uniref:uncharacterized protein LOC135832419 n=1 Tax=Planococcus citri TaxID=170843 RepID=UPI0031F7F2FF
MSNQNVAKTVEELSNFFTGQLECTKCKKSVAFSTDLLTQHLKNCSKSTSETFTDAKDSNNSEIFHQYQAYLKAYSDEGTFADLSNSLPAVGVDQLKQLKISIKQFRCLFCNSCGNIEDWENHVLNCYRITLSPLCCACLLCETLLCGEQKTVTDHAHFKKDASFFLLSHFSGIVDVLKNQLTNYYKFERKVSRNDPKLGFYCGSCNWYLFYDVDKHFSSPSHRLNANITYDLYYCSTCFVIIYGDDKLFYSHNMSKQHFIMKANNKQKLAIRPENVMHRILLMSVKATMDKNISTNPTAQSFYCDLCSFVATTSEKWSQHLSSNDHSKTMCSGIVRTANDEMKPFEYVCVHCKLSIFGTIFTHIAHCTSYGHETIKNLLINYHNDANMKAVKETEALRSILLPTALSERKNNSQINGDSVMAAVSSTSCNQPSTSQAAHVDRKKPAKEVVYFSYTQFIYEKNLDTRDVCDMIENLRAFLRETWINLNVKECKTSCVYCNVFSSNDSQWWTHLRSQPHIDKMNQHYKTTKSYKAIVLFCHCCNISILGPVSTEKKHSIRSQHKKKAEQFLQSATNYDRTSKKSDSSSDAELKSKTNEVISNGIAHQNTISQFPAAFQTNEEFFDDLRASQKASEVKFLRTQSMSSNASSKNDNDDKSEDEGDVVSYVLLNGENDGEEKVSDHELDDSFLSEIENNLPEAPSTSESSDPAISQEADNVANDENTEFVKHLIIAKGIPPQIIQNKRICLETFRRYGNIKRIFTKRNKPDWLYMMVLTEPEQVFNRLHQNIKTLKATLGTDELSIEYDTRNTDQTGIKKNLTNDAKTTFSNMNALNEAVQNLMRLYEEESNSEESRLKMKKIENTVLDLAQKSYGPSIPVKVFTFGSRVTGLATKNSDVDIYLQIDHSFGGGVHENVALQQQLVLYFSNKMRQLPGDYRNIVSIPFARVPIVKFTHTKSNLNCDLSFKSGLSTMNSLLVKTYLKLDDRIKYLVCAVKLWMKKNDLADRNLFTTYAQIWMVLFFLMQPEHAVVPTVLNLRKELPLEQKDHVTVEGWNCAFPNAKNIVWRSSCSLSKEELLLKFFQFYSQENLQNYALCTLTGIKMHKKYFLELFMTLPPTFNEYKRKLRADGALYYKVIDDFDGLCIQDPFDHCHNLTKTIGVRKFHSFINLCQQTAEIMKSNLNAT